MNKPKFLTGFGQRNYKYFPTKLCNSLPAAINKTKNAMIKKELILKGA